MASSNAMSRPCINVQNYVKHLTSVSQSRLISYLNNVNSTVARGLLVDWIRMQILFMQRRQIFLLWVYLRFQVTFTNRGASEQICFRNVNTWLWMSILVPVPLCKSAMKGNTRFDDEEGHLTPVKMEGSIHFFFFNWAVFFLKIIVEFRTLIYQFVVLNELIVVLFFYWKVWTWRVRTNKN